MIRIILVDDESLTILAVRKLIQRSNIAAEVVGEAYNGADALKAILDLKPDIAIIDIRMPSMDGIELMKLLKDNGSLTKIIVLSAYRDFEYAQKAMQYGAHGYLVKPIEEEKLFGLINEIDNKLQEEKNVVNLKNELAQLENYSRKEKLLKLLITDKKKSSSSDVQEALNETFSGSECNIILALLDTGNAAANITSKERKELIGHIEDLTDKKNGIDTFFNKEDELVVIMSFSDSFITEAKNSSIRLLTQKIKDIITEKLMIKPTIGISGNYRHREIYKAYLEARIAVIYRFYLGLDTIIHFDQISGLEFKTNIELLNDEDYFIEHIKMGNREAVMEKFKNLTERLHTDKNLNPEGVYRFCYEMIILIRKALNSTYINTGIKEELLHIELEHLKKNLTLKSLYDFMHHTIDSIIKAIESDRLGDDQRIIDKVRKYCETHFHEDISLDVISEQVNMAKNYFCTFYKKKTGESFWDYLTGLRIEKAKSMLLNNSIKVNSVAECVGYKTTSHFGRIFKEYVGVSPAEYKEKHL
jgi:two-component system, response regulator YesN